MSRSKKRRLFLIITVAIIVGLGVLVALSTRTAEHAIEVRTDTASYRPIVQEISATGKIQPEVEVKFPQKSVGKLWP